MRIAGDHVHRPYLAWQAGILDLAPDCVDHAVVAMDLVELAPLGGQPASDFLAAKLVYKCLGYLQEKEAGAKG